MRPLQHSSYANVASTLALVLVLGGGGAAVAAGLAKNSVGSPQIKNGQVKRADLGKNSVTGAKVANGKLTGADMKDGSLTAADIDLSSLPAASVHASATSSGTLTSTQAEISSVSFTAPTDGFVMVSARAVLNAGETGTYVFGHIREDGDSLDNLYWDAGDTDGFYDQAQSMFVVAPVEAGAHTYTLELDERSVSTTFSAYIEAQIAVQFFPAGSLPVAPRPAPAADAN